MARMEQWAYLSTIGLVLFACVPEHDGSECGSDSDCKGERICDSGSCITPSASVGDSDSESSATGSTLNAGSGQGGTSSSNGAGPTSNTGAGEQSSVGGTLNSTTGLGSGGVGGEPTSGMSSAESGSTAQSGNCRFYPETAVRALNLGEAGKTDFMVEFDADGKLTTVDGMSCTLASEEPDPGGCVASYECEGECLLTLEQSEATDFTLRTSQCEWLFAYSQISYSLCQVACQGNECGDDGCNGSCGECAIGLSCSGGDCKDLCAECLDDCKEFGNNCCTCGAGCLCEGVCGACP